MADKVPYRLSRRVRSVRRRDARSTKLCRLDLIQRRRARPFRSIILSRIIDRARESIVALVSTTATLNIIQFQAEHDDGDVWPQ